MNVNTGACFELNRVGADLWLCVTDGATAGAAIGAIQERYDVTPNIIETDALRLFGELLEQGLVERKSDDEVV